MIAAKQKCKHYCVTVLKGKDADVSHGTYQLEGEMSAVAVYLRSSDLNF